MCVLAHCENVMSALHVGGGSIRSWNGAFLRLKRDAWVVDVVKPLILRQATNEYTIMAAATASPLPKKVRRRNRGVRLVILFLV